MLPEFIEALRLNGKLNKVLDKEIDFGFKLNGKKVGGGSPIYIAGPCSVENREMLLESASEVKSAGCDGFRGGAYKPCTYPVQDEINGWKEGMREIGLQLLQEAKMETNMPIVSEVMNANQLKLAVDTIDIIQVGTRNFQNYSLLDELADQPKPVLLKRGTWGTVEEILGAAERLTAKGNNKIAICLRGVIGGPPYRHIYASTRWQPDLMMILALKELTKIPVIYDPSHATGKRSFVSGISKAAIACGADGLIIEAHPCPEKSISDADQAISFKTLKSIVEDCNKIARIKR
jgi:3-deoxy-7-phosphoheptulonate synthase